MVLNHEGDTGPGSARLLCYIFVLLIVCSYLMMNLNVRLPFYSFIFRGFFHWGVVGGLDGGCVIR